MKEIVLLAIEKINEQQSKLQIFAQQQTMLVQKIKESCDPELKQAVTTLENTLNVLQPIEPLTETELNAILNCSINEEEVYEELGLVPGAPVMIGDNLVMDVRPEAPNYEATITNNSMDKYTVILDGFEMLIQPGVIMNLGPASNLNGSKMIVKHDFGFVKKYQLIFA